MLSRAAVVATLLLATAADAAATADPTPLACQPNAEQPMLPVFHIIGNVTKVRELPTRWMHRDGLRHSGAGRPAPRVV